MRFVLDFDQNVLARYMITQHSGKGESTGAEDTLALTRGWGSEKKGATDFKRSKRRNLKEDVKIVTQCYMYQDAPNQTLEKGKCS